LKAKTIRLTAVLLLSLWGEATSNAAADAHVVLITIDGFPAYLFWDPKTPTPRIRELVAQGATAEALHVSNPTVTWPNHTTLVTGVRPDKHGVVYNGILVREGPGLPVKIEEQVDKAQLVVAAGDDIAVLQLKDASGLTPARLGDSSTVKIGDEVTGVGNAGGRGGAPTVAPGQVTDLGQTITATDETGGSEETLTNLIEVSANLQPGESGGPLYNAAGKVIGVDAAGTTNGRFRVRGVSGRGYAIPINGALAIVKLIESGQPTDKITIGTPPLLGVGAVDGASTGAGVAGAAITNVVGDSPAGRIGLQAGDVIVGVGDTTVGSIADLTATLHAHKAGDKVKITWIDAAGASQSATATLIEGPAN
jgi:S1-C subfamily serine protease